MDATNIKIGACSVKFNGSDIGHTKGGVTLSYEPEYADITADKYGNTVLDKALMGEKWTVTVRLAESAVANLQHALPAGELVGATDGRLTLGREAGYRLSTMAHELVLHPLVNLVSDLTDDVVFYKAVVTEAVEINYVNDEERVVEVVFTALIDTTKSDGAHLGFIGDSTN